METYEVDFCIKITIAHALLENYNYQTLLERLNLFDQKKDA